MWLFTRYGFYSVSAFRLKRRWMVVIRARIERHLDALIKRFDLRDAVIIRTPGRDYLFRIEIRRSKWATIAKLLAEEQTWGNFKSEAVRFGGSSNYTHALHNVWHEMFELQKQSDLGPDIWLDRL